ncbi:hypothetical protein RB599_010133 [Gaeumannomyces hyphopodioides]
MHKVDSAIAYLRDLNPLPTYNAHREHLTPQNAEAIVSRYDLVLDCTDHPAARYLVSDACVLLGKPLVSASALRTDGQLMVLNTPPAPRGSSDDGGTGGPCYRCVFPRPPPADAVLSCGEGGILGPVVGVMGVLQALEALRILAAGRHLATGPPEPAASPTLLLFSAPAALTSPAGFRSVRMRGRRRDCFACGAGSTLSLEGLRAGALDYVQFCGGVREGVRLLAPGERVSASEYHVRFAAAGQNAQGRELGLGAVKRNDHLLLDVREREHFEVASIEGAVNVPFSKTQQQPRAGDDSGSVMPGWLPEDLADNTPIYVVCRVGNDSQTVARQLKDMGLDGGGQRFIGDIEGGMRAWKAEVDSTLPFT